MDRPHSYDAFLSYRRQEPDRTFARALRSSIPDRAEAAAAGGSP